MQFLLVARDDTGPDAPARRQQARPDHALLVSRLKEAGHLKMGGHTLDDHEAINGSAMVLDFPSRADLDAYLELEPYAVRGVWKTISVVRINLG